MKATGHSNHETEIKLAVRDAASARKLLRGAGFRVSRPRVFESNTVFDTAGGGLRASGRVLRIREAGARAILTYKGKAGLERYKSREELEVPVAEAAKAGIILERIGFLPKFRYEKFRTEFEQPRGRGTATVDETPVGVYLELEGSPRWIDRAARALGFGPADYITASYGRLYVEWCAREGREPSHMVFAPRRKATAPSRRP